MQYIDSTKDRKHIALKIGLEEPSPSQERFPPGRFQVLNRRAKVREQVRNFPV